MKIQFEKKGIGNEWLYDMANEINRTFDTHVIVENNRVVYPADIAEGSFSYHKLSEHVDVTIIDLVYKIPMIFGRTATTSDPYYLMHLNCSPTPVDHFTGGKKRKMGGNANSSIYWSPSDISASFRTEPGEKFQAIFICISKEFFQKTLRNPDPSLCQCGLKDPISRCCTLTSNTVCSHQLNDTRETCKIFDESEIISSNLYTSLGTIKYNLVQEIINMDKVDSVSEKIIIQGNVLKILAHFLQKVTSEKYKKSKGLQFGDAAKIIQIKNIIDEGAHFQHFSLDELAKQVGISKTKLKIKFKEIIGTSVYKYYLDVRMARAKDMLHNNPRSITTLAYEMGFKTVSHFSQLYKKYYGINPNSIIVESRRNF